MNFREVILAAKFQHFIGSLSKNSEFSTISTKMTIFYENQIRNKRMMSLIFLTRIPRLPRLSIYVILNLFIWLESNPIRDLLSTSISGST